MKLNSYNDELSVRIIDSLYRDNHTVPSVNIADIVSIESRTKDGVVADTISYRRYDDGFAELVYTDGTKTWECDNLTDDEKKAVAKKAFDEREKDAVYIVSTDQANDDDGYNAIEIITHDKAKADAVFEHYRKEIKEYADQNGMVFDDGETSIEAYEDGYAQCMHFYALMEKRYIV